MSIGSPSLSISQKKEPAGAPFSAGSGAEGVQVDTGTGKMVLGALLGAAIGEPSDLTTSRQIRTFGQGIYLLGDQTGFGQEQLLLSSQTLAIQDDINNSGPPQILINELSTATGIEISFYTPDSCFYIGNINTLSVVSFFPTTGNLCIGNTLDSGVKVTIDGDTFLRGYLRARLQVSPIVANPYNIQEANSREVNTNFGNAANNMLVQLPAAGTVVGTEYIFSVVENGFISVYPDAGDTIQINGIQGNPGDPISSNVIGSSLRLVYTNNGIWAAIASTGSWAF